MIRNAATTILLIALVVLTGCTTTGTASPNHPPVPAGSMPTPPSISPFPARPRALPLDGIDPCSLFTTTHLARLGVRDPIAGTNLIGIPSPTCGWSRFPTEPLDSYVTRVIANRESAYFLANETGTEFTQVMGYGTVRTTAPHAPKGRSCLLFIDVADGQTLGIAYQYEGRTEQVDTAKACAKAEAAAMMALETLATLVPR